MKRRSLLTVSFLANVPAVVAAPTEFVFATPSDDRWHYPFNFTPGVRPIATCFSSIGSVIYSTFNDRDGVLIVAWDTASRIPPADCPLHYDVRVVRVTLTNDRGAVWDVDRSADEWFTYDFGNDGVLNGDGVPRGEPGDQDGESDDADPGRPLELFGGGFGTFFTPTAWVETSFYVGADQFTNDPRDPYPFVFQEGTGDRLHVEDSVKGTQNEDLAVPVFQFTPTPWAIGEPLAYIPGGQNTPFDVVFEVDLSLSNGAVRGYFQEQLAMGRVFVIVTSLVETVAFGGEPGTIPTFFTKEGVPLDPGAKAPQLLIVLGDSLDGDLDEDCDVDLADHAGLVECLSGPDQAPSPTPPPTAEQCRRAFDFDVDNDVDFNDVRRFFTLFTAAQ